VVDVAEALLYRKSAMDWRLTTLKVGVNLSSGLLTLGTASSGLTHSRTDSASDAALLKGTALIGLKIV
jgi:hypothetical protein